MQSRSLGFSDACTMPLNIPALESGLRSASESFTDMEAGSGWSLSPDEDPHFSSLSRTKSAKADSGALRFSILLVEDNSGDVGLVREALKENGLEVHLLVARDGEMAMQMMDSI